MSVLRVLWDGDEGNFFYGRNAIIVHVKNSLRGEDHDLPPKVGHDTTWPYWELLSDGDEGKCWGQTSAFIISLFTNNCWRYQYISTIPELQIPVHQYFCKLNLTEKMCQNWHWWNAFISELSSLYFVEYVFSNKKRDKEVKDWAERWQIFKPCY